MRELEYKLMGFVQEAFVIYYKVINWSAPFASFAMTLFLLIWWFGRSEEEKKNIFLSLAGIFGFLGPVSYFVFPIAYDFIFSASTGMVVNMPALHQWFHIGGAVLGIGVFWLFNRYVSPLISERLHRVTRKTRMERNKKTDVRTIHQQMPNAALVYDPSRYFDNKKGVFLGLDENRKPVYIDYEKFKSSHIQILGMTGVGKGVASTVLMCQALRAGEGVIVLDPKNDEWAPSVLSKECQKLGLPFHFVDLTAPVGQIDLMADMDENEFDELLIGAFSLAEKGGDSDFYSITDRKFCNLLAKKVKNYRTFEQLAFDSVLDDAHEAKALKFIGKIEELRTVKSISSAGGIDLAQVYGQGGCIYIKGSTRNSRILMAQRLLFLRAIQIAEKRDRTKAVRPVLVFLDEFKYHISRPALEGLGTSRDKGLHVVLAHQSIADLKDCPADLNGDAVVGAVVENCRFRLAYRIQDPDTAAWLSKMSGEILVDDETRKIEKNIALAEKIDHTRAVRQSVRAFIDVNMLLNLPPKVGVLFGVNLPKFVYVSHVKAEKQVFNITPSPAPTGQPEIQPEAPSLKPLKPLEVIEKSEENDSIVGDMPQLQPLSIDDRSQPNDR